jgi:hypothetical protein
MGIKMWSIIALRVCPLATRKLLKATPYSELYSGLDDEILVEAAGTGLFGQLNVQSSDI